MTDRLALARRLSIAVAVVAALGLGLPLADSLLRAGPELTPAPGLVDALALSGPALHPAGTPARHPETVPPGVDLHSSPGLGLFPLDDSELLFGRPPLPTPKGERR